MANFVQIGNRVVNMEMIVAAEREGRRGKVTLHLAGPGEGKPLVWEFTDPMEADTIWIKMVPTRGDLLDLEGGPYEISDNETTGRMTDA
jgi:hypothetical protein